MLRHLWNLSLLIRFCALVIGLWGSNPQWIAWAIFYLVTGSILRYFDIEHINHAALVWIIQQLVSVALLVWLVRRTAYPAFLTVCISLFAAVVISGATALAHIYPTSYIEPVMELCGCCMLAMGIMTAITAIGLSDYECSILAIYMLCMSILNLSGSEWLSSPTLGSAVSLLDCIGFTAWGVLWWNRRNKPKRMLM